MTSLDPLPDEALDRIERDLVEIYRGRLGEMGASPEGIFWDDVESMETRFEVVRDMATFEDERVLDVGCGFGDFYGHLIEVGEEPAQYLGVDISPDVLDIARDRYPNARFERRNILREPYSEVEFDVAVAFGALGHNLEGVSNEAYLRHFLRACFSCSERVLVNALSTYREGDWPDESFVYRYSPEKVFGYAQELSPNVVVRHDFDPIPQKEFVVCVGPGTAQPDAGVTEPDL